MSDNNQTDMLLAQFGLGDRVELSPATDRWMRGDRFGTVTSIGWRYVHVKLDRSGQTRKFSPEHIYTNFTRIGRLTEAADRAFFQAKEK